LQSFLQFSNKDHHKVMLCIRFRNKAFHREEHIAHSKYNNFLTTLNSTRQAAAAEAAILLPFFQDDHHKIMLYVLLKSQLHHRKEHIAHSKYKNFLTVLNSAWQAAAAEAAIFLHSPKRTSDYQGNMYIAERKHFIEKNI